MKTHIAICKTHGGKNTTIWLDDCTDLWAAVEKARYLPQKPINYPSKPMFYKESDYLYSARLHEWQKQKTRVDIRNGYLVKEVLEIRVWTLG